MAHLYPPTPRPLRESHCAVEKSMYGKKYMGVERSTFVIGPDGKLTQVFRKVKPEAHIEELLK
jgi:thioredoxin-dependent peroxiredoxin